MKLKEILEDFRFKLERLVHDEKVFVADRGFDISCEM